MTEGVYVGRSHRGDLELDCDVVVVGSGAGGAVVATELALAGQRVVVVEEGRNVPADVHGQMRISQSLRHVWREGGMTVAVGVGDTPAVNVTMGTCVGGSSVVTGGVCFRVPETVLREWSAETGSREFTPEALDPHFSHVEKAIHVEEVPISMRSRSTELFGVGAAKLGYPLAPIRRNTNGCEGCGRCNFGCPHVAKMSVDLSYLPRAIEAGAQVFSDCLVEKVTIRNGRAVGVEGRIKNGPRGTAGGNLRVRAKRVVVACGGIHTPALLHASGFSPIRTQIGKNLTLHPGFRVYARFDEPVRGWSGSLQSAYSNHFEHERLTMVSLFVPPAVIAATMPGSGPRHAKLAAHVPNIAMFGALIHDDGGGYVVRNPLDREPLLVYRATKEDRAAMRNGIRRIGETFLAAGARELFLPILGLDGLSPDAFRKLDLDSVSLKRFECASQHPLGTCRMGVSKDHSGTDLDGKVWGVEELYVADGSIVPSSLGVNPQLTIMALATRVAWKLREKKLPS